MYLDIDWFFLPPKIFGSLHFVHNHNSHKTKLDSKSLKEIFLDYFRTQKGYKCFCLSMGWYITYPSSASDDVYEYLFYKETLFNSGESTSKNVTGKYPFQFQSPLQTYTRRTIPALAPLQASIRSPTQASRLSSLNYLVTLLLMIFSLHFEKRNVLVLNILFPISLIILIYHPPFI